MSVGAPSIMGILVDLTGTFLAGTIFWWRFELRLQSWPFLSRPKGEISTTKTQRQKKFSKKIKTVLTGEFPVLTMRELYKNPLRIIEIGQPWRSTDNPSAELNARIRSRGNWTHSMAQGCSLKRFRMFLKRLQEAILKGRVCVGIVRYALPFFLILNCRQFIIFVIGT